ncbi:MAG: hypothetical protein ACOX1P_09470 [Thermoguttaceae bacterium]
MGRAGIEPIVADVTRPETLAGLPPAETVLYSIANLIHVDDAVRAILAAESKAAAPGTYLASDGSPTTRRDFYREIALLLGTAPPRFSAPAPGSRAAAAMLGNKRISNRRMLEELGVELRFPSFRVGLAAILGE